MRSNIFSLSILNLLRPALLAGALLVLYLVVALSLYPLLVRFPDLADWVNASLQNNALFFSMVVSVDNPTGYLYITSFSLLLPLLLSLFAVSAGLGAMNSGESRAAIELLLARPLLRRRLILEKYASLAVVLVLMCITIWAVIALRSGPSGLWINPWQLAQAMLLLTLLSLTYGSIGLAAGSILRSTANGRLAAAAAVVIPLAFFLMQELPGTAGKLKFFSPFFYAAGANPLASGFQTGPILLLAGLTAACLALAVTSFEQRDL